MTSSAPKLVRSNGKAEFKIEKGVPMPPQYAREKYPFRAMEVGDSFFVAGQSTGSLAATYARVYAQRHRPIKFTARKVDGGFRIWRIA